MPPSRKTNAELLEENHRLRAQIAQLQDRLDHLEEHGAAAKALHQAEAQHREVMSVVSDTVLIADDAGRLSYVSPNAHFIFGHSAEDIQKHGRIGFLLPANLFDPDLLEQRREIANISCEIRDAVGRSRSLLVTVRNRDGRGGEVMYVCRDVTDRVKLEQRHELLSLTLERRVEERTRELRESRERYRRLVEGLRDEYLFFAIDPQGLVTYVSPSIHPILGYTPTQVIGRNWREFVDFDEPLQQQIEEFERMRANGIQTPPYTVPIPHANGEIRMLEFRDMLLRDEDGNVIATEGIGKDVTEQFRAEEKLLQAHEELERRVEARTAELRAMNERLVASEQRYRSIVEDQVEYISRWRGDGIRTFVNESYCRSRKATREELIGTSFMPLLVEEDREHLKRELAKISIDNPLVVHEHRIVTPDGEVRWEQWSNRALFSPEGELLEFQALGIDTTERRKREEHAREREKSLAKLTALSERERHVMRLVVAGDANKVIARKLELSIKTIEKHRSSLMKKLNVRSVPELVRLAMLVEESTHL